MCRDILNTCVRNTEDAERAAANGGSGDTISGKKAAVWGMIEESELAKTIRGGFDKVWCHNLAAHRSLTLSQAPSPIGGGDPLVVQARQVISELEDLALRSPLGSSGVVTPDGVDSEVMRRADSLKPKLQRLIEESLGDDSANVDELLALNDSLTNLLASPQGTLPSTIPPLTRRPSGDKGARLTVNIPLYNGDFVSPHGTPATSTPNGHIHESPSAVGDSDEELVSTPRLDKGKQRAKEEPEKPTPVLRRPSLVLDEEAEYIEPEVHPEVGISPTVDR